MPRAEDRLYWLVTAGLGAAVCVLVLQLSSVDADSTPADEPRPEVLEPRGQAAPPVWLSPSYKPKSRFHTMARIRRDQVFSEVQGDGAFTRLGEPLPGQWLFQFKEPGQTLVDYAQHLTNRKTATRRCLHLQPFSDLKRRQRALLRPIRTLASIYFDSPVKVLPEIRIPRRFLDQERGQYRGDLLVRWLSGRVPGDSLGVFSVLGSDLFTPDLNFVFGLGLLQWRASVHSLHRYGRDPRQLLLRSLKLTVHETGHMFGLEHCVFYRCLMNGANSLSESDAAPIHLCPVCLAKLHWNLRFDPVKRYRRLARFYRKVGLKEEARFVLARAAEVK